MTRRAFFLLLLALAPLATSRAQGLEIIRLQHRSAEQLLPQVQPFVGPGGALTGVHDTLFVRAAPANLAEIRRLVASLDTPVRRLLISLRQEDAASGDARAAAVAGRIGIGQGAPAVSGTARVYRSERDSRRGGTQQVQTIDGGRAAIMLGQSVVLPLRQTVLTPAGAVVAETWVRRELGSGFVAVARIIGNPGSGNPGNGAAGNGAAAGGERVSIEISPLDETPGRLPGSVNTQRLSTTVVGALGEWIDLGGTAGVESRAETGIGGYVAGTASRQRRLWLKVEALP